MRTWRLTRLSSPTEELIASRIEVIQTWRSTRSCGYFGVYDTQFRVTLTCLWCKILAKPSDSQRPSGIVTEENGKKNWWEVKLESCKWQYLRTEWFKASKVDICFHQYQCSNSKLLWFNVAGCRPANLLSIFPNISDITSWLHIPMFPCEPRSAWSSAPAWEPVASAWRYWYQHFFRIFGAGHATPRIWSLFQACTSYLYMLPELPKSTCEGAVPAAVLVLVR